MRPAKIIAAVALAAAVAATGSYLAVSTASHPSAAAQPPGAATLREPSPGADPQPGPGPDTPTTTSPHRDRPGTDRCDPSALPGVVQGSDGAAGTIWMTIQLRNASAKTCTVKGIPQVRLLGAQGQPVTAPSRPEGPAGSRVVLGPGRAASFELHYPNACDRAVAGSRLQVTLPRQGLVIVPLGSQTRFGTCASVGVRALQASTATSTPPVDRISDPQLAADRLVAAWLGGDRAAAGKLATSPTVTERLFSESPPAHKPGAHPCRLVDLGLYLCSYRLTPPNELNVWVTGGASVGYGVSNVEFVD